MALQPVGKARRQFAAVLSSNSRPANKMCNVQDQLKIQNGPIVMKPGSLDSSGDLEYYGFYIFALSFLVFEIFNF